MATPYRTVLAEYREEISQILSLRRLQTRQHTPNDDGGIFDGWIASILVWAAVIAMLLSVVAALLGPAD